MQEQPARFAPTLLEEAYQLAQRIEREHGPHWRVEAIQWNDYDPTGASLWELDLRYHQDVHDESARVLAIAVLNGAHFEHMRQGIEREYPSAPVRHGFPWLDVGEE